MSLQKKITTAAIRKMKQNGQPIRCLSLYDALSARLAEAAGIELLLIGDSLGMTVLGYDSTVNVTLEQTMHHTAAVKRGSKHALIVADLPFGSYHASEEQAINNAVRMIRDAGADAVKIEGGVELAPLIKKMIQAGIPVMGHIGLLPQQVLVNGGYRVSGKNEQEAQKLTEDALALQEAGCFAIVGECVKAKVANDLSQAITIPLIGIGSGNGCDGQIQVITDILGMDDNYQPKHSKAYTNLGRQIHTAMSDYASEVSSRKFPSEEHSF